MDRDDVSRICFEKDFRLEAKVGHHDQRARVVVIKWNAYILSVEHIGAVLVGLLRAQIHDAVVCAMALLEERHHARARVAVCRLETRRRKPHRDDRVCDVRQVEVVTLASVNVPVLVLAHLVPERAQEPKPRAHSCTAHAVAPRRTLAHTSGARPAGRHYSRARTTCRNNKQIKNGGRKDMRKNNLGPRYRRRVDIHARCVDSGAPFRDVWAYFADFCA